MFSICGVKLAAKCGKTVPETRVGLAFMKSEYLMRRCILTMMDGYLDEQFVIQPVRYQELSYRLFFWDSLRSSGGETNGFLQASGSKEDDSSQWVAKVLLLFRISVRKSRNGKEYGFLHYMYVSHPIGRVSEIIVSICLGWVTDDKVNQGLRQGTVSLEQAGPCVGQLVWHRTFVNAN